MATRPHLRLGIVVILLAAASLFVGACGSSSSGGGEVSVLSPQVASLQRTDAQRARAARFERVREAVLGGLTRDFAEGTGIGGPAFESCLKIGLRDALDRPTLVRLAGVYRRRGGPQFAAQALNTLAMPLAASCGRRTYVPEMVNASRGLRGARLAGASLRKLDVTYGPYLGVRCRRASRTGCDRVGIDIVFAHAATEVVAVVDGRQLPLRTPGRHDGVRQRDWVGTLANAGLSTRGSPFAIDDNHGRRRWFGSPPVYVPIEFRVRYADRHRARAYFPRVFLSPGWG